MDLHVSVAETKRRLTILNEQFDIKSIQDNDDMPNVQNL